MDAILDRRSIRFYTSDPVDNETITELLHCAMAAPSAGNEQPWQFVVMNDTKVLARIPEVHPYARMVPQAAAAILVCGDLNREKHKGFWVQDCSAATENLLIAVQAKGLGAVWLGVYPRMERVDGLRKLLNMPEHIVPFALVPVGHPAEQKARSDRFEPERIHYNSW